MQQVCWGYTEYQRITRKLCFAFTKIPHDHGSCPPPSWSDVQSVRLSRNNCMMSVESLYESSDTLSSSAIASSKAVRAILHASSGFDKTSYWKTEKLSARPRRIGCVTAKSFSATFDASSYARRAFSEAFFFASSAVNSAMYR